TDGACGFRPGRSVDHLCHGDRGADAQDGTSWDRAYSAEQLQTAIDNAPDNSQVWVAAGTYYPTRKVIGPYERHQSFQLKNGVAIYGGFPANPVKGTGMESRDWETNRTILSGDLGQQGDPDDN